MQGEAYKDKIVPSKTQLSVILRGAGLCAVSYCAESNSAQC